MDLEVTVTQLLAGRVQPLPESCCFCGQLAYCCKFTTTSKNGVPKCSQCQRNRVAKRDIAAEKLAKYKAKYQQQHLDNEWWNGATRVISEWMDGLKTLYRQKHAVNPLVVTDINTIRDCSSVPLELVLAQGMMPVNNYIVNCFLWIELNNTYQFPLIEYHVPQDRDIPAAAADADAGMSYFALVDHLPKIGDQIDLDVSIITELPKDHLPDDILVLPWNNNTFGIYPTLPLAYNLGYNFDGLLHNLYLK